MEQRGMIVGGLADQIRSAAREWEEAASHLADTQADGGLGLV